MSEEEAEGKYMKCPECGLELEELPCANPETAERLGHITHLRCPNPECPTAYVILDEHEFVKKYRLKEAEKRE